MKMLLIFAFICSAGAALLRRSVGTLVKLSERGSIVLLQLSLSRVEQALARAVVCTNTCQ